MDTPPVIILVRHAQSEHHIRGLTGGWTASPLTALGHQQAGLVAARLRRELGNVAPVVYTSDLPRSRQTAEHIAAAFEVAPLDDLRLREHNNGAAVDLTLTEARARFPGVYERPWELDFRPFEGAETARELYARAAEFMDGLPVDGPLPIVVSHGGTIRHLVARWLGIPPEAVGQVDFAAHTTAIAVLQTGRFGRRAIERMNDIAHLAGVEGWVPLPAS
ncbi:MAG: histidine phosphatase family protein, partial [Dehalococcoidia bacterium]